MHFLKNGPAKSLDFNCSDLQRMSTLRGYESPSYPFFSISPRSVRTVLSGVEHCTMYIYTAYLSNMKHDLIKGKPTYSKKKGRL